MLRLSAWMPPWLVATSTASTQKCHVSLMKNANTVMKQYTPMPTPTMKRAPKRSASLM